MVWLLVVAVVALLSKGSLHASMLIKVRKECFVVSGVMRMFGTHSERGATDQIGGNTLVWAYHSCEPTKHFGRPVSHRTKGDTKKSSSCSHPSHRTWVRKEPCDL
mmetsp:Transcript_13174/g.26806  ORF Transcript_13174/g.26806 Transcript_13174/m.26806 type:complete len:105 (-) Transcript_13174:119-433(-)